MLNVISSWDVILFAFKASPVRKGLLMTTVTLTVETSLVTEVAVTPVDDVMSRCELPSLTDPHLRSLVVVVCIATDWPSVPTGGNQSYLGVRTFTPRLPYSSPTESVCEKRNEPHDFSAKVNFILIACPSFLADISFVFIFVMCPLFPSHYQLYDPINNSWKNLTLYFVYSFLAHIEINEWKFKLWV